MAGCQGATTRYRFVIIADNDVNGMPEHATRSEHALSLALAKFESLSPFTRSSRYSLRDLPASRAAREGGKGPSWRCRCSVDRNFDAKIFSER